MKIRWVFFFRRFGDEVLRGQLVNGDYILKEPGEKKIQKVGGTENYLPYEVTALRMEIEIKTNRKKSYSL